MKKPRLSKIKKKLSNKQKSKLVKSASRRINVLPPNKKHASKSTYKRDKNIELDQ